MDPPLLLVNILNISNFSNKCYKKEILYLVDVIHRSAQMAQTRGETRPVYEKEFKYGRNEIDEGE